MNFRLLFVFGMVLMLSPGGNLYSMGKKPQEENGGKTLKISTSKSEILKEQSVNPGENQKKQIPMPVYIAELSNINDYTLFANSGWDGNWYAGFNVCWMEEFAQPPKGKYSRAFIGAKLGRMKTRPAPGKPVWEKEAIPGEIYMSLSSTPSWKSNQRYFLTLTRDIPVEGDAENALESTGESRWFWVEVPIKAVNMNGANYAALYSPTEYFTSTSSSPAIAGGWGSQKVNSWLNNDVKGYPPINAKTSLKTPITVFEPAIAMKLIPEGAKQDIVVDISEIKDGKAQTSNKSVIANITGNQIEQVWLEVSVDGKYWEKQGRIIYSPPYILTLKADSLPQGKVQVRCAAADIWENKGYSVPIDISVSN
jgi:hypothetical protein